MRLEKPKIILHNTAVIHETLFYRLILPVGTDSQDPGCKPPEDTQRLTFGVSLQSAHRLWASGCISKLISEQETVLSGQNNVEPDPIDRTSALCTLTSILPSPISLARTISMFVRFQVLMAACIKMIAFWAVAPYSLIVIDQHFNPTSACTLRTPKKNSLSEYEYSWKLCESPQIEYWVISSRICTVVERASVCSRDRSEFQ
jgi:hypothetical protein